MRVLFLSGVAALALSHPAVAQSNEDVDIILVEATRTQLDADIYPGMTGVIDAEDLDLLRPTDLDDLLRGQAGVEIAGGPRRTGQTISLRGQGRDNTLLLLDGARQNFSSAHDGAIFVDPALLVSVETVRGPASALYGSGASGGVIAFRTASAHDLLESGETWGVNLGAGYRSVDKETRATASVYGRSGAFDAIASLSRRNSGDIELGSGASLPAEDESLSGLLKFGLDMSEGVRTELTWQFFESDVVEPNNGQGGAVVGPFNALAEKDVSTNNLALTLSANPASLSWMDLDVTVYRNESGVDEFERAANRSLRRDLETTGIRADQRFAFNLGTFNGGLTVGGEHYEDEQVGFDSADPNGVRGGAPTASSEFSAWYAQLELTGPAPFGLPGEIVLLPGVRNDSFDTTSSVAPDTSNDKTSSRFGMTYAPIDDFSIFASWGEAFRAPSINELYIDGTHFSLPHFVLGPPVFVTNEFIANPNLLPEETKTVEIGFRVDLSDRVDFADQLDFRVSWFDTEAENLIDLFVDFRPDVTCFVPPFFQPCTAGTTQSRNVSSAELEGVEAQFSFARGNFSLDGTFSDVDGRDVATGNPLGSLTPRRVFLDGRWVMEEDRWLIGSRVEWAGEFDETTSPTNNRDGYAVVDVYTRWRPMAGSGLTINAGVDNLLDEDYERVFAGVSEPARSYRLDFTWSRNF